MATTTRQSPRGTGQVATFRNGRNSTTSTVGTLVAADSVGAVYTVGVADAVDAVGSVGTVRMFGSASIVTGPVTVSADATVAAIAVVKVR